MKSAQAQVLGRLHSISHDTGVGSSNSREDDVLSLNSWSDEIVHIHSSSRPATSSTSVRRTQSVSASSSDSPKRDVVFTVEQSGAKEKRRSLRRSKRVSTSSDTDNYNWMSHGQDGTQANNVNAVENASPSSAQGKAKILAYRHFKGRGHDSSELPHSSINNSSFPLSLDLKSASFECPSLWENPSPISPSSDIENRRTNVIKGTRILSHSPKSKGLSSLPSDESAQSQKLYPDLEELRVNDNEINRDRHKVLRQTSSPSSKTSPTRPQFFDYSRSGHSRGHRQRGSNGSIPSSSVDPKKGLYPSLFTPADVRAQHTVDEGVLQAGSSQQSYFKSQPTISSPSQRLGFSLKPNSSSSDLESMNKQNLEHLLERENVKSKMMTVWNNIKYGWTFKPKSNIRLDSPLFLLGKVYHKRSDGENEEPEFLQDFTSRIWLTYRNNFYPIPGTKFTTDCGWGCMLRSGQMLMAQCFISHFLGRDWRLQQPQTETQLLYYKEILRWFSDPIEAPSDKVPFSLHNLVNFGRSHNKVPGEWYGPGSVAYIFRDALTRANLSLPILKDVCIYVAQDCTVYMDDVNKLCRSRPKSESGGNDSADFVNTRLSNNAQDPQASTSSSSSSSSFPTTSSMNNPWCRSLIMLIPVRLGGESMNEIYSPCIKSLLSYPHCMGIIGGKPKHSLYFIGWQDNKLIYLDPHYCRESVDTTPKNFSIETYHCTSPRKLSMNKMDPSCTIGFYIKDADEFNKFVHDVMEFVSPPKQKGLYPLFIFANGSQEDADLVNGQIGSEQGRVKVKHYYIDENGQRHRTETRESEEFIML